MEKYISLALLPVFLGLLRFYTCKSKNWSYSYLHGLAYGDKKMPLLFLSKSQYKMTYVKDIFWMSVVNFYLLKEFFKWWDLGWGENAGLIP